MLNIFKIMLAEATELRRLANNHPKGSKQWQIYTEQADQLYEQAQIGIEYSNAVFMKCKEYSSAPKRHKCSKESEDKCKCQPTDTCKQTGGCSC